MRIPPLRAALSGSAAATAPGAKARCLLLLLRAAPRPLSHQLHTLL
jgi:hypothetical protein